MFAVTEAIAVCPDLFQNPSVVRLPGGDLLLAHTDLVDVMAGCPASSSSAPPAAGGATWWSRGSRTGACRTPDRG